MSPTVKPGVRAATYDLLPLGLCSFDMVVRPQGEERVLGHIHARGLQQQRAVVLGDRRLEVRRRGVFRTDFEVFEGAETVATIRTPKLVSRTLQLAWGEKVVLEARPKGWWSWEYELLAGEGALGRFEPVHLMTRRARLILRDESWALGALLLTSAILETRRNHASG